MAKFERGTYQPPADDVHVFDGSEDDEDVEGSRLPLLIVIALFVLAAFAGVVWLAYTQGVARGRNDVPRTIAAEQGPAKVASNGSEGSTPYKGLKIYEQPAPADEEADQQSAPPPTAVETTPPQTAPATVVATPPKPETTTQTEPPLSVAKSIVPPVVKQPQQTPAAQTPATQATTAPAQLQPKVTAPSSGGAYVLQIGAYKSADDANAAWRTYQAKHAILLAGDGPDVLRVDLGDKGVWFRLRTGSFADKAAALAFCSKLTAEGGACFPAK